MDPQMLTYCTLAAAVIGAVVSVLRPDNTALPIQLSPKLRAFAALVLGAIQTCLMATVGGQPLNQSIVAATVSVIIGWGAGGATRSSAALDAPGASVRPKMAASPTDLRGFVRLELLVPLFVLGGSLAALLAVVACTPAMTSAVVSTIPIIDGAVCKLAATQPNEPQWEIYACEALGAGGQKVAFTVRVPKAQSAAFSRAHAAAGPQ